MFTKLQMHSWVRRRRRSCFRSSKRHATKSLARTGAGTVENAQYPSQLNQQQAAVKTAQATLTVAQRQIEALKARRNSAEASLAQAKPVPIACRALSS